MYDILSAMSCARALWYESHIRADEAKMNGGIPKVDSKAHINYCLNCTVPPYKCKGERRCPFYTGSAYEPRKNYNKTRYSHSTMADVLLRGLSCKEIAKALNVSLNTVTRWKNKYREDLANA